MKATTTLIVFMFIGPTFAQTPADVPTKKPFDLNPWDDMNGCRVAASYFKDFEVEVSYVISSYPSQEPGFGGFAMLVQNVAIGPKYLKVGNAHAIGARLSYEAIFSIFAAQLGADFVTSDVGPQFSLTPRLGLSVFSLITIYYGWSCDLQKQSELRTATHTITLQINFLDM
ncbi:MAG: hypothetical protein EOO50_06475 [Flavobacterium sp.]|uniref:hypothetical protein n=1 Tax=Flavobacterium sp. TaxID=239 RepID=UPI0011F7CA6A|nr:hypothetical protein [Flavobacterium sp.]RZJ67163.1 MAG: hypothetical protein EOO50_06475 [Flavobacterium sp.]